jgi:phosphoribosyl-ATP pyrophosphohydrolase
MLKSRGVALGDVMDELARRQGQSGLSEKAARKL